MPALDMSTAGLDDVRAFLYEAYTEVFAIGLHLPYIECGPKMYALLQLIIETEMDLEQVEVFRSRLLSGRTHLLFAHTPIMMRDDVPDMRFWPTSEVSPMATNRRLNAEEASV